MVACHLELSALLLVVPVLWSSGDVDTHWDLVFVSSHCLGTGADTIREMYAHRSRNEAQLLQK